MNTFWTNWTPQALSILRIITGFLFLWHGSEKLLNFPPEKDFTAATGLVLVAGILELGGGILFLIGLFTRPVAFVLCGLMAVAYFMVHAPGGFLPIVNHGESAVLYCFIFFYFIFAGCGAWGLDRLIWKAK